MCAVTTPRVRGSPFAAAGSAALGDTPRTYAGGAPYQTIVPKWLDTNKHAVCPHENHACVVFILGGPGAGKGTMCRRIAEEFRYVHLSMGDLLRAERARPDSEVGQLINSHIQNGTLVPADVTVGLLLQAMQAQEDWKRGKFLIDGFPRDLDQIEAFNNIMGTQVVVKDAIYFDCTQCILEKRLLALADSEHAREDDTIDVIHKRVENYITESCPVQRYFQWEGLLERIDANRDIEKVWLDVQMFFVTEAYHDLGHEGDPSHGSPIKAIWKLRAKQSDDIYPTGHSHTCTSAVKGEHARAFSSFQILKRHRDKHTRNMKAPTQNFHEPVSLAQEIGWHQPEYHEEHSGAKGTPRGGDKSRSFYPRNTCSMTRHMENMYSTNAQHIIRRW